jgi:hypothetical protein
MNLTALGAKLAEISLLFYIFVTLPLCCAKAAGRLAEFLI